MFDVKNKFEGSEVEKQKLQMYNEQLNSSINQIKNELSHMDEGKNKDIDSVKAEYENR
jgi:hypothetical protein